MSDKNDNNADENVGDENVRTQNVPPEIEEITQFDAMDLPDTLLRGIYSYGFEKPSKIQQRAIVPFIKGYDVIAQSQSGTGKTGAFTIGTLAQIQCDDKVVQVIVISPTRELAEQTAKVYCELGGKMNCKVCLCIGGTRVNEDIANLRDTQIVIGTPGRIYDLVKRRALMTERCRTLIIDEADEMLSFGFKDQVYNIFRELPSNIQVGLFSATLPPEVLELTDKFMREPVISILVKKEELTLEGIRQFYVDVQKDEWKFGTLLDLYKTLTMAQTILYVNSKRRCDWLSKNLEDKGYSVSVIHGGLQPWERKQILTDFRKGETRILIATDLLSRGIDVQQVSLVVNYDLPKVVETYIHRIGRSGRFGRKGTAINFCTIQDINKVDHLRKFYSTQIDPLPTNVADLL